MSDEKAQAAQAETTPPQAISDESLLDDIIQATSIKPSDDYYSVTKAGLQAFLEEMLKPENARTKIAGAAVDQMIAEIDKKLSAQVDEILHNEDFRKLESAWRSLKYLVDHTEFRENVRIDLVNATKTDLLDDFEDAPEVTKSGLYKTLYTAEYGQFGGKPYGAIIGNFEFGPGPQDIKLLQYIASVSAMSHAPFFAAAGKQFFGIDDWSKLPDLKDLHAIFESPQYVKWQSFRESEDSRYVGLSLPRFLLRLPYGPDTDPAKSFHYKENVSASNDDFCWGNTAFAFAAKLTDSFAKYRWCANIIGPQGGGAVEDLPVYQFEAMGAIQSKIPTEILISERREYELSEEGFIALTMRKGSDNAAFFSANSCQKPKFFGISKEGKEAELNYKLSTQMPYMMIVNRLAHYIKVLQRENIGTWKERSDLETELNKWVSQYVTEMDNPNADVRSRRPLRMCRITVSDVEGDPGWYSVSMMLRPHFKYMGAFFTLSLVGKLDKK